jgi:hypothetical protein
VEKLYKNYVSHFILMLVFVCKDLNLYKKIWIFEFVLYNKIQTKLKTKFKQKYSKPNLSNEIEHNI